MKKQTIEEHIMNLLSEHGAILGLEFLSRDLLQCDAIHYVRRVLRKLEKEGRIIIVCGGHGYASKSLYKLSGIGDEVKPIQPSDRDKLQITWRTKRICAAGSFRPGTNRSNTAALMTEIVPPETTKPSKKHIRTTQRKLKPAEDHPWRMPIIHSTARQKDDGK